MFLYLDGMTTYKGNTPKFGYKRHSRSEQFIESRIISVDVACGSFEKFMLFYTDDLISGGANIMIEVLRQSKYYLYISKPC